MVSYCHHVFFTDFGWMATGWTGNGLCSLLLPEEKKESLIINIRHKYASSHIIDKVKEPAQSSLREDIRAYFRGEKVVFKNYPLDLDHCTLFQKNVFALTRKVPYGKTATYADLSRQLDPLRKYYRAIGGAMASNPVPLIIPCHRIIKASGEIGGFSAKEGVNLKKKMLELEKIHL